MNTRETPASAAPILKDPQLFRHQCFVGGSWVQAEGGDTFPVFDPSTGGLIGEVPNFGTPETLAAIENAATAFRLWRRKTAKERAVVLHKWYDLIVSNVDDLARLLTAEQGKPLSEARGEILLGAAYVEWFSEEAKRTYGETIPSPWPDKRLSVIKQPVGVCAAITPWNFPNSMITRKVAPALAAGCSVIVNPAEQTPYSALALAELASRAGIPDGVLNVITGEPQRIGMALTQSTLVRKLSFTGSTEVGRILMQQSGASIKKISLELGGNAPFIVFDDADVDAAVEGAMVSKYRNSGQTCVSANRLFVQKGIYAPFAAKFAERVRQLKVGAGIEPDATQGPLIDTHAIEKVEAHITDAVGHGARILTGGRRHSRGGTFFEPTVISGATEQMRLFHEETFGPLAPLFEFDTEEEVVRMANATEYGLVAYFFSRDIGRITRVSEALEYGMVAVNSGFLTTEVAPFGGVKQSGLGREGARQGIEEYLEAKYVCVSF